MDLYVKGYAQAPKFTRFPPSAMTSNSQTISGNTYTASKAYGDGNQYIIFDYSDTTPWYTIAGQYSATGDFLGRVTTVTTDGTSYAGVWVQLYCSQPFYLTSHTYKGETAFPTRYPAAFVVLGSSDGTNWTLIDYHSAITYTANAVSFSTFTSRSYQYYRMVTLKTNGNTTTTWTEWELYGSATPPVATFSYDFLPPADLENTICDSYVYGYRAIPGRYIDINMSNRLITFTTKKLGRFTSNLTSTSQYSYTGNQFRATYTPSGGTAVTATSNTYPNEVFVTTTVVVADVNAKLTLMFGAGKVVCSFNDTSQLYTFTCPTAGDTISIDHTYEWGPHVLGFTVANTGNVVTADTAVFQTLTISGGLIINVGTTLESIAAQLNAVFQNNRNAWNTILTAVVVNSTQLRISSPTPTDEINLSSVGTFWAELGFPVDTDLPNSNETPSVAIPLPTAVEDYTWLSSNWRQPTLYHNTYLGPGPVPVYIPAGQQTVEFSISGIMTSDAVYDVEFFLRLVSRTH